MSEPVPYPTIVVCFLLTNQFAERFAFYGMRAIITLYMTEEIQMTEEQTSIVYHIFLALAYTFPILGAILADSWCGKFRVVFYISLIYVMGMVLLALSSIEPLHFPRTEFAILALVLIALGAGGIKPCIAAFGGDQFVLPQQEKEREGYFHLFYFAINIGSLLSIFLIPVFRKHIHCFNKPSCYSLGFGVCAAIMVLAVLVLLFGKPFYKMVEPQGNMLLKISKCIGTAVRQKCISKGEKKDHWLDYAAEIHGQKLVNEIKIVLKILYLYIPLPFFWALFEQIATGWTFQARRMKGEVGNLFTILPDQMQIANPVMVLMFIPVINYCLYPVLNKMGMLKKPLQKIATGGFLTSVAYIITAMVEIGVETTLPVLPTAGNGQLRIFNILPCDIKITCSNLNGGKEIAISKLSLYAAIDLPIKESDMYNYTMTGDCSSGSGSFKVEEKEAASYFFSVGSGGEPLYMIDELEKTMSGNPNVRIIINSNGVFTEPIKIKFLTGKHVDLEVNSSYTKLNEISPTTYDLNFDDKYTVKQKFAMGGVYTLGAIAKAADNFDVKAIEVTQPNSVHILWMVPQYAIISLGECMLAITGIEFSYSQAPISMKSVLQAAWLLTSAFGQVIVVIIQLISNFSKYSSMFFLYAILMAVDMVIFAFMTLSYTYIEENDEE